jgi:hypothetical protein
MTLPPGVSVIIPNYNYGDYVGQAIESALNLDWPAVEVIVVDDGSTDHSRAVIESFGSRISAILQDNAGQLAACNQGFSRSRGDMVIFLDSDDVLAPSLVREAIAAWTPRVSKVQVQMEVVDASGKSTGSCFPQYAFAPSPEQVRAWALATGTYPTPPGSGNVYARWFLERIFPLRDVCGKASDTYSIAAAPLLGDVVTIPRPLVYYRVHGRNQVALSGLDVPRFHQQMVRVRQQHAYARTIAAGAGLAFSDGALDRSLEYLPYRMASLKLAPAEHAIEGDTLTRVLRQFTAACFVPQGLSLRARLLLLAWAWAVALSPQRLAGRLILWRFAAGARPHALRRLLAWLRVASGPGMRRAAAR